MIVEEFERLNAEMRHLAPMANIHNKLAQIGTLPSFEKYRFNNTCMSIWIVLMT